MSNARFQCLPFFLISGMLSGDWVDRQQRLRLPIGYSTEEESSSYPNRTTRSSLEVRILVDRTRCIPVLALHTATSARTRTHTHKHTVAYRTRCFARSEQECQMPRKRCFVHVDQQTGEALSTISYSQLNALVASRLHAKATPD